MKRKIKNIILMTITVIMGMLFLIFGIGATEVTTASAIITAISLSWLFLFTYANKDRFE